METSRLNEIWGGACKHLQEVLHPDAYSRWISVIQPHALKDNALTLSVANDFYQTWLVENYLSLISSAISTVCGEQLKISFVVCPEGSREVEVEPAKPKISLGDRLFRRKADPQFHSNFTFETFVVGPSNNFSHAAALAVAQAPGRAYNPLLIYGNSGLGKTHLLNAIGRHVMQSTRSQVCLTSCEAMMNEFVEALQTNTMVQFRRKFRNTDVLLIDDIHFLGRSDRLQEEVFHTFNTLFDMRKQIVMTSDRPAREISGLEQRLVSRFDWGLVTELETPDFETRLAIIREKQATFSRKLTPEFLDFIAKNIKTSVRDLEGALVRCISYASLTGRDLTQQTMETLLRDLLEKQQQQEVTFDTIQRTVAQFYDIRLADMTSHRRPKSVAVPRQIAMYLCRKLTPASLPDIANSFSKTHATILHAFRTMETRMTSDARLRQDIAQLAQKLGKSL
jgi:chromosomal replication initiator protein